MGLEHESCETVVLSMQAQREMLAESMTKRPFECGKRPLVVSNDSDANGSNHPVASGYPAFSGPDATLNSDFLPSAEDSKTIL